MIAVGSIALYWAVAWLGKPAGPLFVTSAWAVTSGVSGIALGCAQYLESWFRGTPDGGSSIDAMKLEHQACWHVFTVSWTAIGSAVVGIGIFLGLIAQAQLRGQDSRGVTTEVDLIVTLLYILVSCLSVMLWIGRPSFARSAAILKQLRQIDGPSD